MHGIQCQDEFKSLKEHLTEKVTLQFYDVLKSVELHADASENSIGALLLQRGENHISRPITCISRTSDRKTHYGPTERGISASVQYSKTSFVSLWEAFWCSSWSQSVKKIIFGSNTKISAKIFRWQLEWQRYSFAIKYWKGKEHIADFISPMRHSKDEKGQDIENPEQC